MNRRKQAGRLFIVLVMLIYVSPLLSKQDEMWFFVLVKSSNYSQDQQGRLKLLNFHFFSELFARETEIIESASLSRVSEDAEAYIYEDRGEAFYYEGGHFNSLDAVDAAHPNGEYDFNIKLRSGKGIEARLSLVGPGGKTDIPAPIRIQFYQGGREVKQNSVDPARELLVKWSAYSNGTADPRAIVDDMIFVVFQDCHGERIFHTGLPFKEKEYMKYDVEQVSVPAGRFASGQTYSLFVEFPHVVDSVIVKDVPGFSSYATATYTDISTLGEKDNSNCPSSLPPLDSGQTDRMEVEIH